jgi:hypothetical protein
MNFQLGSGRRFKQEAFFWKNNPLKMPIRDIRDASNQNLRRPIDIAAENSLGVLKKTTLK